MQVFKTFLKIAKKRFPSVLLYYIIFTVIVNWSARAPSPAAIRSILSSRLATSAIFWLAITRRSPVCR